MVGHSKSSLDSCISFYFWLHTLNRFYESAKEKVSKEAERRDKDFLRSFGEKNKIRCHGTEHKI